jgi:hypothetical protein
MQAYEVLGLPNADHTFEQVGGTCDGTGCHGQQRQAASSSITPCTVHTAPVLPAQLVCVCVCVASLSPVMLLHSQILTAKNKQLAANPDDQELQLQV